MLAPVVLVIKKNSSHFFGVDYRSMKFIIVRDSHQLPRMYECVDSLKDATMFSTLNADSEYGE